MTFGRQALPLAVCGCLLTIRVAGAEPLAAPSFGGALQPNPSPLTVEAGPFGNLAVTGQLSAIGLAQTHALPFSGPRNTDPLLDLGNAQIELQTTGSPLQFYLQAGAYALPSLGTAYMRASDTTRELYGYLPVAYAKIELTPALSVQAGSLPTLIGAESTFTFQNMNIARGLLWNQEPAISRGVQVNYSEGPVNASLSLNDGFYSGSYTWLSGLVSYAITPNHTIAFAGGGNLSDLAKSTPATPLAQNNSSIFNLIYTYSDGPLTISPYLQYSRVDGDRSIGIDRGAETYGAAILARYKFDDNFSLAGRAEYIWSRGGDCAADTSCTPTNLLYGPGSGAWSLTVTPTYQHGIYFVRGELSYTRIDRMRDGFGFGPNFDKPDQIRAMIETGVLF